MFYGSDKDIEVQFSIPKLEKNKVFNVLEYFNETSLKGYAPSPVHKHRISVEGNYSAKHSSLLQHIIWYCRNKFYSPVQDFKLHFQPQNKKWKFVFVSEYFYETPFKG
jgi:hypothetical protein